MKLPFRIISATLSLILCMTCLASCKNKDKDNKNKAEDNKPTKQDVEVSSSRILKLCYSTNDYLNPYQVESTVNQILMPLMYDSLFRVDGTLKPIPLLAKNGSVNGKSVVVNLNTSARFSDGSALTPADVVYSFNRAVSSPAYSYNLSNFASAAATSGSSVTFTLKSNDKYALSCLTFAIVKNNSAPNVKINPSTPQVPPVGTGRYIYSSNGPSLTVNSSWIGGQKMSIGKIELVNVKTSKSIPHSLVIGNIDFTYDNLSSGSYSRIAAASLEVPQNDLIFLGFNVSNKSLQNTAVRTAIAMSVDHGTLVASAYSNHARSTSYPYPEDWYALSGTNSKSINFDQASASRLLKSNGYEKLALNLIINSGNAFRKNAANVIKEQLKPVGIDVNILELSWGNYIESLKKGYYDIYIGEVKLSNNLSLSPFFTAGGSAAYGINVSGACANAYTKFTNGEINISAFIDAFNAELPFIPLCYRSGIVSFTRDLKSNVISYNDDVFYNIFEWKF